MRNTHAQSYSRFHMQASGSYWVGYCGAVFTLFTVSRSMRSRPSRSNVNKNFCTAQDKTLSSYSTSSKYQRSLLLNQLNAHFIIPYDGWYHAENELWDCDTWLGIIHVVDIVSAIGGHLLIRRQLAVVSVTMNNFDVWSVITLAAAEAAPGGIIFKYVFYPREPACSVYLCAWCIWALPSLRQTGGAPKSRERCRQSPVGGIINSCTSANDSWPLSPISTLWDSSITINHLQTLRCGWPSRGRLVDISLSTALHVRSVMDLMLPMFSANYDCCDRKGSVSCCIRLVMLQDRETVYSWLFETKKENDQLLLKNMSKFSISNHNFAFLSVTSTRSGSGKMPLSELSCRKHLTEEIVRVKRFIIFSMLFVATATIMVNKRNATP